MRLILQTYHHIDHIRWGHLISFLQGLNGIEETTDYGSSILALLIVLTVGMVFELNIKLSDFALEGIPVHLFDLADLFFNLQENIFWMAPFAPFFEALDTINDFLEVIV